jgi:hypothetical protein
MRKPGHSWEPFAYRDTFPVRPLDVRDMRRKPRQESAEGLRYLPGPSYALAGRNAGLNGNTLILASSQFHLYGQVPIAVRLWMTFLGTSAGDDGTDNTSVEFRAANSGALGTYTVLGTLDTSAAPVAGQTVHKAIQFPLDDQKVLLAVVTLNAAGVSHDLDAFALGVDTVVRMVSGDQQGLG